MTSGGNGTATAVRDREDALPSGLVDAFEEDDETPRRRRRRLRRALWGAVVCVLVLLLTPVAVLTVVGMRLSGDLDRIPGVFDGMTDRPTKPASGPGAGALNILVLGTDRRSDIATTGAAAGASSWEPGEQRSDAMMVLHLDGDRDGASLISIPRDSWVSVPGRGMAKINAAFSSGGASLAVQTVEALTSVRIDHVAVVDWAGFSDLVDALGGVTVRVPETVTDTMHGHTWTAGRHDLDGADALAYVGQRYGLPGGDLDRVRRQQAVFRGLATETLRQDPLRDPMEVYGLLDTLVDHISVDDGWSTREMASVLLSLRGMRGSDITYLTVPVAGLGDEAGQSVVHLDQPAGDRLWGAVLTDEVDAWAERNDTDLTPAIVR